MEEKQIQIKARDEDLKGVFANLAIISHTKDEFCLDFINSFAPVPILTARVIVTPTHAKRIFLALKENIEKYEEKFGKIEIEIQKEPKIGFVG